MEVTITVMRSASAPTEELIAVTDKLLLIFSPRVTVRGIFQLPPPCYQY